MKAVIRRDSVSSSTWWKPHFKSNLLNTVDPFKSCRISSIVGMGCVSLSIASLALLISTQTRMSPSGFGTTTRGETHSVGPLGTSSMMSSLSNSSSCLLPSDRLCNRLNVFVHRQLNFQFTHSRKNISKVLNNVHRSSFTYD